MPLVAKGSLFAQHHSLAMAGVGTKGYLMVTTGALGGGVGTAYLTHFRVFVDETDPKPSLGMVFDANAAAFMRASRSTESLKIKCESSETCIAAKGAITEASEATVSTISSIWNGAKAYVSKTVDTYRQKSQLEYTTSKYFKVIESNTSMILEGVFSIIGGQPKSSLDLF